MLVYYVTFQFVPKNLFEQFRRVANIYFLLISALQLGTTLSPTNKYATAGPLAGILFVTMIKELFEDYVRERTLAHALLVLITIVTSAHSRSCCPIGFGSNAIVPMTKSMQARYTFCVATISFSRRGRV